jgi:hypothetical protein
MDIEPLTTGDLLDHAGLDQKVEAVADLGQAHVGPVPAVRSIEYVFV